MRFGVSALIGFFLKKGFFLKNCSRYIVGAVSDSWRMTDPTSYGKAIILTGIFSQNS
jgi:hypothetical protein